MGRVYLVGAGPGDPGLITVKGAEKLAEADVVLHDGLANPAFRVFSKTDAEWISVGKHGGERIWKQSEIDDAMVLHARRGKTVVRLKGGDTGLFARSAEELDRLVREGIPFEVVPGVTAALAVAAYTGIPITHRDWSSCVALVTGQLQASDGAAEVDEAEDWLRLARFPGTLVVYMGVTSAPRWSRQLIAGGMPERMPVALVRRCSWPDQETIFCELKEVASLLHPGSAIRPPVVAIIGKVAHLGKELDWFSKRALHGKSVLVARAAEQASETIHRLESLGAHVIAHSVIEIRPLDDFSALDASLIRLSHYGWVVFTSANGVDHFFKRLDALGKDARSLCHTKLAGVGPSVIQALERWKLRCDLIPNQSGERWNAESLARTLIERLSLSAETPPTTLVVRANRGKTTIEERLVEAGYPVESVIAYQSVDMQSLATEDHALIENGSIDYVLATSPSVASGLLRLLGDQLATATWIAISEVVAQSIQKIRSCRVLVAKQSSIESMIETILADRDNA